MSVLHFTSRSEKLPNLLKRSVAIIEECDLCFYINAMLFCIYNLRYFLTLTEGGLPFPNPSESLMSTLQDANEMVRKCLTRKLI